MYPTQKPTRRLFVRRRGFQWEYEDQTSTLYIYIYIDTYSVYKYWSLGLPFLLYFTQILLFIPFLPYSRFRKNWVPFTKVQTFQILLAMDSRKNNSWNLGERNTPCFFQAPVDDLPPLHSSGITKKITRFFLGSNQSMQIQNDFEAFFWGGW